MKNMKWLGVFALSFTLLLANSFTSITQSNAEKHKIAVEFFDKGKASSAKGNYREAIEHYTVAIALDPDYINAYQERGNAKLELRDYKAAIADYDKVIQVCCDGKEDKTQLDRFRWELNFPYRWHTYNNRGVAKYRLGNKIGACEDLSEACKLNGNWCEDYKKLCNADVSSDRKSNLPSSSQPNDSPLTGQYSGTWILKATYYDDLTGKVLNHSQIGTWTLSIDANGKITGKTTNRSNEIGNLSGSVDEDGYAKIIVEYPNQSVVDVRKGTLIKTNSGHLKGTLTGRWLKDDLDVNFTTEIDLLPNP